MTADHPALGQAMAVLGFHNRDVSTSLKGLAPKRLVTIARTPTSEAQAVELTAEERKQEAPLGACCE